VADTPELRDDGSPPIKGRRGTIALLVSSHVFEDFLDSIGVSLDEYFERLTGGWGFGYIDALRSAGWETVMFLVSREVEKPVYRQHAPSGTRVCLLPAWKAYYRVTRGMVDPYGWAVRDVFGPVTGIRRMACFALKEIMPYLSTPIGTLMRELRREGCTAILTQEYEHARFDACVLVGKLLQMPVFATFQGGSGHNSRLQHMIRPIAVRAAGGLAIGAGDEAQRVIQRYRVDKEKVWLIPNPLDLDLWHPMDRRQSRQALGLPLDRRIVIYHGRIDMRHKGLDVLLDAWERVRTHPIGQDGNLLMIGSGPDDAKLRERLGRREVSGVQWVDRYELDKNVIRRYLCAADVYVFPSRFEGFPVAPLEAMACGLPIIGSDIPAMLNILEHGRSSGGLVVPREDPLALADAISELLADLEFCRNLGQNARRNVEERYSIESVGRLLDQLLSSG
jgi:glycosyltransferase involved in cell wall biosynthesis